MTTEGIAPLSSISKRSNAYPVGSSLEEMTETCVLLDAALDAADPYTGDLEAWLLSQKGALN